MTAPDSSIRPFAQFAYIHMCVCVDFHQQIVVIEDSTPMNQNAAGNNNVIIE